LAEADSVSEDFRPLNQNQAEMKVRIFVKFNILVYSFNDN